MSVVLFSFTLYDDHMATLIVTILMGLVITYFATQNTDSITLHFLNYTLPGIPLYAVVVGALLLGLFLSWLNSLVKGIATGATLRGKESKIKGYGKENAELTRKIHQLELENARLETALNLPAGTDDKSL